MAMAASVVHSSKRENILKQISHEPGFARTGRRFSMQNVMK
jgi:predicted transcriptional regulator